MLVPRAEGSPVPVPAPVLSRINGHIDVCKRCRIELKGLRLTTFALGRIALKSHRKSFDPHFAERVLDRVRRGEIKRKRSMAHLRIVCAGLSAALTLAIAVFWIGGFNALSANWLVFRHLHNTSRRINFATAPYPVRDPFALPIGGDLATNISDASQHITDGKNILPASVVKSGSIPDLLSHLPTLVGQGDPSHVIINVGNDVVAIRQGTDTPAFAKSSFQQQDRRTLPPILSTASSSYSNSNGLSVVTPAPAAPAAPLVSVPLAATSTTTNSVSSPTIGVPSGGKAGLISGAGTNPQQPVDNSAASNTPQINHP
jgi:hypothetical protein